MEKNKNKMMVRENISYGLIFYATNRKTTILIDTVTAYIAFIIEHTSEPGVTRIALGSTPPETPVINAGEITIVVTTPTRKG